MMSGQTSKTNKDRVSRRRLPRSIIKLAIVIVAIAALVVLAKLPTRKQDAPPSEVPPVDVAVMTVTAEPQFADTFDVPATVEPNQIVTVSAEVAGQIEWIGPKEGAVVHSGDLLLRLNTDLLQAEMQRVQAQATYDQSEFDRKKGLVQGGAAPDRDLDEAVMELAVSKAQLEEVRVRLARARIVAPFSGVLNDLPVEQGEYVQPGTAVASIVDAHTVKVVVDMPERDLPFFAVGAKAEICMEIKGCQQSITGTVTFISELADPKTRSTRMEIAVANKEGLLRSGQLVRVRLTRRILDSAILVPLQAVIPLENSKTVYVVESSKAQRREVELGLIRGDRVQVTNGLKAGDRLIVSGHRLVAPGQDVNVAPKESESK
jgi:membrane fusion protein (multidrug efflux system)